MKEIIGVEELSRQMGISKNRLYVLLESHRIRPDIIDDKDRAFWMPETAERLAKAREQQKHLPRSVKRAY